MRPGSAIQRRVKRLALGIALALALGTGCSTPSAGPTGPGTASFEMPPANRGTERYSAWFADSDGRVLYFGLGAFWEAAWARDGEPTADLDTPGDHLIGRFDLEAGTFLEPLRVRGIETGARSSVWDVLVHSSGRICYTTYFEQLGCVDPDGSNPTLFEGIGAGYNELYEGPGGRLYVTRYASAPVERGASTYGAVAVLAMDGRRVRELLLPREHGELAAAKSLAVDPLSGDVWVNTDTFRADGEVDSETLRLARDGAVLERGAGPAVLQFASFDRAGRGWWAEAEEERLRLRVTLGGVELARADLGPQRRVDFIQDIHFAADGRAVLAAWSGRIWVAALRAGALEIEALQVRRPADCQARGGPALVYSAFLHAGRVYATALCGGRVLSVDLPSS